MTKQDQRKTVKEIVTDLLIICVFDAITTSHDGPVVGLPEHNPHTSIVPRDDCMARGDETIGSAVVILRIFIEKILQMTRSRIQMKK